MEFKTFIERCRVARYFDDIFSQIDYIRGADGKTYDITDKVIEGKPLKFESGNRYRFNGCEIRTNLNMECSRVNITDSKCYYHTDSETYNSVSTELTAHSISIENSKLNGVDIMAHSADLKFMETKDINFTTVLSTYAEINSINTIHSDNDHQVLDVIADTLEISNCNCKIGNYKFNGTKKLKIYNSSFVERAITKLDGENVTINKTIINNNHKGRVYDHSHDLRNWINADNLYCENSEIYTKKTKVSNSAELKCASVYMGNNFDISGKEIILHKNSTLNSSCSGSKLNSDEVYMDETSSVTGYKINFRGATCDKITEKTAGGVNEISKLYMVLSNLNILAENAKANARKDADKRLEKALEDKKKFHNQDVAKEEDAFNNTTIRTFVKTI